ncbi:MAG: hypothetical protein R3E48_23320 [Burkholderiaceae bacterium]
MIDANRSHPGGDSRYTELDGDIGLLVAGGGAGLLQHDMILAMGGRPANHSHAAGTWNGMKAEVCSARSCRIRAPGACS